jgi:hypothetical protein
MQKKASYTGTIFLRIRVVFLDVFFADCNAFDIFFAAIIGLYETGLILRNLTDLFMLAATLKLADRGCFEVVNKLL